MEKIIKKHVEKIYTVENKEKWIKMRFYDEVSYIEDNKILAVGNNNYSPWVIMGIRIDLEELKKICQTKPQYLMYVYLMERNGYDYICWVNENLMVPMSIEDRTYEEYLKYGFDENRKIIRVKKL